ncbi:Uncharacterized protein family (UPF0153) [Methanocella conradii HZ254]|uniref:Uncharacterized protein family (UPF0153) n=1 Tax=Methanocella conradii (strain DSM 24694 / JCM 17849 / CGMCC 1.5162 / HZ254) TaxID=1041930 RepID=H8I995_METCZ|nr:YkgJ family cysteine cluster protein [Methanocella conradii]AFC99513.1 Uncharacterized protein family (UPF0153) [Methanocella conradii HZ254]MDI6898038.1 YkgJ family cysteine cluster protein [Methanocella conradii]
MLSRQEFFARARGGKHTIEELYAAYETYSTCPAVRSRGAFKCMRCGSCCRRPWRVEVSVYDVQRWIYEKRLDIMKSLEYRPRKGSFRRLSTCEARSLEIMCSSLLDLDESLSAGLAFAIAASRDGSLIMPKDEDGCVYLEDGLCTIYETRPQVCASFPDAGLFEGLTALLEKR